MISRIATIPLTRRGKPAPTLTLCLAGCWLAVAAGLTQAQQETPEGDWWAAIECPGGDIAFGVQLKRNGDQWTAELINGTERIRVPQVSWEPPRLTLALPHYDSRLELLATTEPPWQGTWRKRRSRDQWVELPVVLRRAEKAAPPRVDRGPYLGRWAVKFESSTDPAVGVFQPLGPDRVQGTFLTTTGDYRFLAGRVTESGLALSCFDGAHAFLFRATRGADGTLQGDFWSSDTWHETWQASPDEAAQLPDAFRQTLVNQKANLADFSFPNLDGVPVNLADPRFDGQARLIYVFGSWCPNCHDAATYLSELDQKYRSRGLSILGLAFELTGDFERDAEQVKRYLQRHDCTYPVLIAGTSDKAQASRTFPLLDRIRSYPTTLFLDRSGTIRHVHTGFSGPATGADHETLRQEFEQRIEELLKSEQR